MQTLRFSTAGNVDDGKSTLIGRLLLDQGSLPDDRLPDPDKLHHVTDGLRMERSHGITVDVAYRYFCTPARRFVLADCPGHQELLPAFFSGVSQSEVSVLLVDAIRGISRQTRTHLEILRFLEIPKICVAVNKLDDCDYSKSRFQEISKSIHALGIGISQVIPVSAKLGDNIVRPSTLMPWYTGPTLMRWLEIVEIPTVDSLPLRVAIQEPIAETETGTWVAGSVIQGAANADGEFSLSRPGHAAQKIQLKALRSEGRDLAKFDSAAAVSCLLESQNLIPGSLIHRAGESPRAVRETEAQIFPFQGLEKERNYFLLNGSQTVSVQLSESVRGLSLSKVSIRSEQPFFAEAFGARSVSGRFLLVDANSLESVAAGVFSRS